MKIIFNNIKNIVKCWLLVFFWLLFFFGWVTNATDDLLWQIVEPSYNNKTIMTLGRNVNTVWNEIFKWTTIWKKSPSVVIKITRFLLILTITLSVTMILYNGMIYIIQTWQGKESKDLTKNIVYIVIWILVALFSVVIITLIQSIPSTLWDMSELPINTYEHDKKAVSFKEILP